jgi:hypothetical protein
VETPQQVVRQVNGKVGTGNEPRAWRRVRDSPDNVQQHHCLAMVICEDTIPKRIGELNRVSENPRFIVDEVT